MVISFFRFVLWLLAVTFVVQMGWSEPLRYRFLSQERIREIEAAQQPVVQVKTSARWKPMGTSLANPREQCDTGAMIPSRNPVSYRAETPSYSEYGSSGPTPRSSWQR